MTTPNGQTTLVKLDSGRRITGVIGPLTNPWTTTYSNNALQSVVEPNGSTTTYINDDGTPPNVTAEITPEGRTSFTYVAGTRRVQSTTDALGRRTTLTWSSTGQITTRINPLNQRTTTIPAALLRIDVHDQPIRQFWAKFDAVPEILTNVTKNKVGKRWQFANN